VKFFQTGCTACAHFQIKTFSASLLVTASNRISRARLLATQGASAMSKLNFAKVEFGIIERSQPNEQIGASTYRHLK
jgi:hypothetical protein